MDAPKAERPTELLVIGTAHVGHEFLPRYSWKHLEQLLDELGPDALCLELRAEEAEAGQFTGAPEMHMVGIPWANRTGHPWYPVDWHPDGKPSEYHAARRAMESTPEGRLRVAHLDDLDRRLVPCSNWGKNAHVTFREFNSPEQVQIARECHQLETAIMGEGPGTMWWNTRNGEICHRIDGAIEKHRGQRIGMLTGYEHKYWIDDYFAEKTAVAVTQVNDLPIATEFVPDQSFDARVMRLFMYMDGPWSEQSMEPDGVLPELDDLARENPGFPPLDYLRGRYYLIVGECDRAVSSYGKSTTDLGFQWNLGGLRAVPLFPMAVSGMGQALDAKGERQAATECYRKVVESLPIGHFWAQIAEMRMKRPYRKPDTWPQLRHTP